MRCRTYNRKKILIVFLSAAAVMAALIGRLAYLMLFEAEYYQELAQDLHERERPVKAARGEVIDRNGTVLATNRTVCTISVIHSQITEPERVVDVLSAELEMEADKGKKRSDLSDGMSVCER